VTDTTALINAITNGRVSHTAIDCWEGEPNINRQLLNLTDIATPHIAGYSKDGKLRATQAAVKAVATALNIPVIGGKPCAITPTSEITIEAIKASYNPIDDTRMLKENPERFEALRNGYNLRTEVTSLHH
jgi:erythronate-4-phosphate dehydrogenase